MRTRAKAALAGMGVLFLLLDGAQAQSQTVPNASPREKVGRVITPEPPRGNLDGSGPASVTTRPTLPERNEVPKPVMDQIKRFRTEADAYVDQQERLRKQLLGATTETERQAIRTKLQLNRDLWLERARQLREDFRDRQKELMDKMPNRRELLREAAQDNLRTVRDAARETINDKRRGMD